jgi:hypothetical protein
MYTNVLQNRHNCYPKLRYIKTWCRKGTISRTEMLRVVVVFEVQRTCAKKMLNIRVLVLDAVYQALLIQ